VPCQEYQDTMELSGHHMVQPSLFGKDEFQIELADNYYPPWDYACTLAERVAQAVAVTMS
jgi:hypothetical protein